MPGYYTGRRSTVMNGGELRISTGVSVDAVDALSRSIAIVVLFTFRHLIIVTSLASPLRHDTLIDLTFVVGGFSTVRPIP